MSGLKVYRPSAALSRYVRYYWIMECHEPSSVLTFPIGCPQMIFHKRTPLFIPELGCAQSRFTVSGQVNFPAHVVSDGDTYMIVAVFYPHTIERFISVPPSEFYNMEISGYDIGNDMLNQLAAMLFETDDREECIRLLDRWLMRMLHTSYETDRMEAALKMLFRSPSACVTRLAETACLGKKQFERVFRRHVGMNPKEYARVVRFQKAMSMMQQGVTDFVDISYGCGYSDQSHLIREFRIFSGHSPGSLLQICQPYSDLFTNPV